MPKQLISGTALVRAHNYQTLALIFQTGSRSLVVYRNQEYGVVLYIGLSYYMYYESAEITQRPLSYNYILLVIIVFVK